LGIVLSSSHGCWHHMEFLFVIQSRIAQGRRFQTVGYNKLMLTFGKPLRLLI